MDYTDSLTVRAVAQGVLWVWVLFSSWRMMRAKLGRAWRETDYPGRARDVFVGVVALWLFIVCVVNVGGRELAEFLWFLWPF